MRKLIKALAVILSMSIVVPITTSCRENPKKKNLNRVEGCYAYSGLYFDCPEKEGYKLYDIGEIFLDKGDYCVPLVYSHFDETTNSRDYLTDILTIDQNGTVKYTLEISKLQIPRVVLDTEYAFLAYPNQELMDVQSGKKNLAEVCEDLVFFDKKTGETTRVVHPETKANSVYSVSDGILLVGEGEISICDKQGILQSTIAHKETFNPNDISFFMDNESIYLCASTDDISTNYYKLNFSSQSLEYIIDSENISSDVNICSGQYYFGSKGEYKIDLINMQIQTMALWNEIDIRPNKTTGIQDFIALDDTHFVKKVVYDDGTGEIGFFAYDSSLNQNRTPIVVGGFGVFSDYALQWAVYNFNIRNSEFRVVLEDYSDDFSSGTPQEAQMAKLKLMKYFNEGHAPDVFYGDEFDYQYFGHIGIVADLIPFFNQDPQLKMSDLISSIENAIMPDGKHCYSVFSSYRIDGFCGLSSDFNTDCVSIFDIHNMSQKTGKPFTSERSAPCIAGDALLYSFSSLWGAYGQEKLVTREKIEEFVSTCIELGIDPAISWGTVCPLQGVSDGLYYLSSAVPTDIFTLAKKEKEVRDGIVYVGYPSVYSSVHLAVPQGIVGIASSTKYPEKCWELVRELLLPEIQKKMGSGTVNKEVYDLVCRSAMNPEYVTDEEMKRLVLNQEKVSKDVVDDYTRMVLSIDTIKTIDWGAYNIICEEVASYYTQNRSVNQIAETLDTRLSLYVQENYQ